MICVKRTISRQSSGTCNVPQAAARLQACLRLNRSSRLQHTSCTLLAVQHRKARIRVAIVGCCRISLRSTSHLAVLHYLSNRQVETQNCHRQWKNFIAKQNPAILACFLKGSFLTGFLEERQALRRRVLDTLPDFVAIKDREMKRSKPSIGKPTDCMTSFP